VGAVRDAYIASAKSDYLGMIQAAIAADIPVVCIGVAPRHDTTIVSLGLSTYASLSQEWNAWLVAQCTSLGVPFVDLWEELEDPATPNQLVSWADAGDQVHWTNLQSDVRAIA
jgi:hypothetical protein